jgi:sirohydrochlorin cobaltochelatase
MVQHAGTTLSLVTRAYGQEASDDATDALTGPQKIHHLGFVVTSADAVNHQFDRLSKLPQLSQSFPTVRLSPPKLHRDRSFGFYLTDPDGTLLEWIYIPSVPYQERTTVSPPTDPFESAYVKTGILLLAHGSSDPSWAKPVFELRDRIRADLPACLTEVAFMEFASPTLEQVLLAAKTAGRLEKLERILVFPHFISSGGHVSRDLPSLIHSAQSLLPSHLSMELCSTLGEGSGVRDAMLQQIAAAVQKHSLKR